MIKEQFQKKKEKNLLKIQEQYFMKQMQKIMKKYMIYLIVLQINIMNNLQIGKKKRLKIIQIKIK